MNLKKECRSVTWLWRRLTRKLPSVITVLCMPWQLWVVLPKTSYLHHVLKSRSLLALTMCINLNSLTHWKITFPGTCIVHHVYPTNGEMVRSHIGLDSTLTNVKNAPILVLFLVQLLLTHKLWLLGSQNFRELSSKIYLHLGNLENSISGVESQTDSVTEAVLQNWKRQDFVLMK